MISHVTLTDEIKKNWNRVALTNLCDWNEMCDFIDAHFTGCYSTEVINSHPYGVIYIENRNDAVRFKLTCIN